MLRITYNEDISTKWHQQYQQHHHQQPLQPNKRRVYRWGSYWGLLSTSGTWTVETRRTTDQPSVAPYIVEVCQPIPDCLTIPAASLDDVWDEEYVAVQDGLEYTGLVILTGTRDYVLEIAEKQGLPLLPLSLPLSLLSSLPPSIRTSPPAQCTPHAAYQQSKYAEGKARNSQHQKPAHQARRCLIRD